MQKSGKAYRMDDLSNQKGVSGNVFFSATFQSAAGTFSCRYFQEAPYTCRIR